MTVSAARADGERGGGGVEVVDAAAAVVLKSSFEGADAAAAVEVNEVENVILASLADRSGRGAAVPLGVGAAAAAADTTGRRGDRR